MNVSRAHIERAHNNINQDSAAIKKAEPAARQQTAVVQGLDATGIEDIVEISAGGKDNTDTFQDMLEEMRNEMRALREGLKQAREAGEGAAEGWRVKIKLLQIAMRIMSGHKVPVEDHRFLMERDAELYSRAIKMRIVREDPDEYDRLSEDEDNSVSGSDEDVSMDAASAPPVAEAEVEVS